MGVEAAHRFAKSAFKLRTEFPAPKRLSDWHIPISKDVHDHAAFLLIDLNDLWGNFCRSMILENAAGGAYDLTGAPILPTHALPDTAAILAAVKNRRGFEPKWHNAQEAVRAEKYCATNKSNQILMALSVRSSPAPIINTVRNYFCHRRSDCRDKLQASSGYRRNMGLSAYKIGNFLRSDGRSNIEFWTKELTTIAYASVA